MSNLQSKLAAFRAATFPSHEFAEALRELLTEVVAVISPEAASEGEKVYPNYITKEAAAAAERWNHQLEVAGESDPGIRCAYSNHYAYGFSDGVASCQPTSEGAKVECPNCGQLTSETHRLGHPHYGWACEPAQPEPVAPSEMPLALQVAVEALEHRHRSGVADGVRSWWRSQQTQPAPAAVRMTPALQEVLNFAQGTIDMLPDESWQTSHFPKIHYAIHEVRAETEQAQVKLPTVRAALECAESRLRCLISDVFTSGFTDRYGDGDACRATLSVVQRGLAELNRLEGK